MKKATVQINFDEEKLQAVKLYMNQKQADIDREFEEYLEKIYCRYVPVNVRQFIDLKKEEAKSFSKDNNKN